MGKRKRKIDLEPVLDATPERIGHALKETSDPWDFVNPALIDSNQTIGLVRRFRTSHLDRWYRKDCDKSLLTWRQWYAGDWYRNMHHRAGFTMSVVSNLRERTSGGSPSYGLARTEQQARARDQWREARAGFSKDMVGFMDRFLLRNELPRLPGGYKGRTVEKVAGELDELADWIKLPGCNTSRRR